jgi:hypothetical protein
MELQADPPMIVHGADTFDMSTLNFDEKVAIYVEGPENPLYILIQDEVETAMLRDLRVLSAVANIREILASSPDMEARPSTEAIQRLQNLLNP